MLALTCDAVWYGHRAMPQLGAAATGLAFLGPLAAKCETRHMPLDEKGERVRSGPRYRGEVMATFRCGRRSVATQVDLGDFLRGCRGEGSLRVKCPRDRMIPRRSGSLRHRASGQRRNS